MAFQKEIIIDGFAFNYHRVSSVELITNLATAIHISSYASAEARKQEKEAIQEGVESGMAVPVRSRVQGLIYDIPYVSDMTVDSAYEWLKQNIPEFKDAEDV